MSHTIETPSFAAIARRPLSGELAGTARLLQSLASRGPTGPITLATVSTILDRCAAEASRMEAALDELTRASFALSLAVDGAVHAGGNVVRFTPRQGRRP